MNSQPHQPHTSTPEDLQDVERSPNPWMSVVPFTVIADLLIIVVMLSNPSEVPSAIFIGLAAAQASLVCCWHIFGKQAWAVRAGTVFGILGLLVLIVIGITINSKSRSAMEPGMESYEVQFYLNVARGSLLAIGGPMGTLLLLLAGIRFFGISPSRSPSMKAARDEMRFSIRRIFAWTTFVAIAASFVSWIGLEWIQENVDAFHLVYLFGGTLVVTCICVVTIWGMKRVWLGVVVAFAISSLSCVSFDYIYKYGALAPRMDFLKMTGMISLVQAITLTAWLNAWRVSARSSDSSATIRHR